MAKFHYPFQKILDLKENEKEFAQIKMAEAIKQQEISLRKNQEIYQGISKAENLKKQKQQVGVNIFELRELDDYIKKLKDQLLLSEHELMQSESNVIKTQSHLRTKVQEEKTWINLKNKKLEQFEEKIKLSEQTFFDEMASTRFYRASFAERG
jgi:flagellar protein FliJ